MKKSYTKSSDNIIRKIRALVDAHFSNSIVEAYNKILKYQFLYLRDFPDCNALKNYLPKAITEYNEVRPHHAHNYLTPLEALNGNRVIPGKFQNQFKQARISRNMIHSNPDCQVCLPDHNNDEE